MGIELKNIHFSGYHGLHAGEEILGNKFLVNLTAWYEPEEIPLKDISSTIDYTQLYQILNNRMSTRTNLLETLATEIGSEIIAKFNQVNKVEISIIKLHAPIEKFEGSVGVTFKLSRD